ncbi:hypothetical protein BDQ17DRAFT_881066 [Cyathus striatus]|nr:hypothetical protein BDQ17DRAFT_881066 [Cyathus striatus]
MYRIFLGAPPAKEISTEPNTYQWQTVSSQSLLSASTKGNGLKPTQSVSRLHNSTTNSHSVLDLRQSASYSTFGRSNASVMFLPATLEAASVRISKLYQNAIFDDAGDEGGPLEEGEARGQAEQTMGTWLPTQEDTHADTRLTTRTSFNLNLSKSNSTSNIHSTQSQSFTQTQETQQTYGDASSIGHFPTFHFSLHTLTTLPSSSKVKSSRKGNLLLAVLEVEGPDRIGIKKGPDAGKEVSILKLIVGDEEAVGKMTIWREVAELWGGIGDAVGVKRGDVVLFENVTISLDPTTSPTITASPFLKSKMTICYRTMPHAHEDSRLRPDLRLAESEPCVRKVANVVRWFERMAGLTDG